MSSASCELFVVDQPRGDGPSPARDLRLRVLLIAVGRPRAPGLAAAISEYEQRAAHYWPFAAIEVEWMNDGSVKVPNDAFVTQVIKADANGVFCYAMPRAGWWGFAALVEGNQKMKSPAGKMVDVELGGLIWVKTVDMK